MGRLRGLVLAAVMSLPLLVGCRGAKEDGAEPEGERQTEASTASATADDESGDPAAAEIPVTVRVARVALTDDSHWGFGRELVIGVFVDRTDIAADAVGSVRDLPPALRPERLALVAGTQQASCDRNRYPFPCTFRLAAGESLPKAGRVEVTFGDGSVGSAEAAWPVPASVLAAPDSLELSPDGKAGTAPLEWALAFRDPGTADTWEVIIEHEIGGDGNPFVDFRTFVAADGTVEDRSDRLYTVTVARADARYTIRGTPGFGDDGERFANPGPVTHVAVCGSKAATENEVELWVRECHIEAYAPE